MERKIAKRALKDRLRLWNKKQKRPDGNAGLMVLPADMEPKQRNWTYVLQMTLLVLLLLLGMLGSFVFGFNPLKQQTRLGEPPELTMYDPAPAAPVGDQRTGEKFSAVLSFLNSEKTRLFSVPTEIELVSDETRSEAIMHALLAGPADGMLPILPLGTELSSIEISRGVATVVLSTEALMVEQEDRYKAWYAITNTLTEMSDINNVVILVDGRQPGFNDLPLNPLTKFSGDLNQAWRQRVSEDERFLDQEQDNRTRTHNVVLYFAARGSGYLLPEIHQNIQLTNDNYIDPIMQELLKGPSQAQTLLRVLPTGAAFATPPEILSEPEGKVLRINFDNETARLIDEGDEAILTYAAIVHTFSGFIPGIESVQFEVEGQPILQAGGLEFENGRIRRGDVDTFVGRQITLYFKDESGTALIPVRKTVGQRAALAPRTLILELMDGPQGLNTAARAVFPADIGATDIIGVRLAQDGQMLVNLSRHFADQCMTLTADQERAMIFSIVNTLTENSSVKRVWFYIDGAEIDSLAGHLYMRGYFLRNPGMILTS